MCEMVREAGLVIGAFSVQPSEFMKLAMIAFLAKYLSERQKYITSFKKGLAPSLGIVFLAFGMIMLQPDLGTGTVMVGTCIVMIFIAGARISHFVVLGLIGVAGFAALVVSAPYRMKRITSFLDPWEDPLGKWVSNYPIAFCDRSRWIVWIGVG